jgi:hypothetical protein
MMSQNELICAGVNELYLDRTLQHESCVLPNLCLFELTIGMIKLIKEKQEFLIQHNLTEVVLKTTNAKWYFQLTNRYHHEVVTYLHVRSDSITFSGKQKPYKEIHFSTPSILLSSINRDTTPIHPIQLDKLATPYAKSLIKKIQSLNHECDDTSELYWELDNVFESVSNLDEKVTNNLNFKCDSVLLNINDERNRLEHRQQKLEVIIEHLLTRLVKQIFGINKGDWISYVSPITSEITRLRFDESNYHKGLLTIFGVGITKAGVLGKREQTIHIELLPES